MTPDSIGTKDIMAIVVSKDSLNWYDINKKISQHPGTDYAARLESALGRSAGQSAQVNANSKGNIHFAADGQKERTVVCLVEVNK
jgi:hypothetical protein